MLIGQKLEEHAKIERFKCDILDDFQTMCALQFTLQDSVKKSILARHETCSGRRQLD